MIDSLQNIFRIPDLRKKILFTLGMFIVYRLGGHIPVPGINTAALAAFFDSVRGSVLGLYDIFAGGNLRRATIFALGIMPYISASIILQLLSAVIPYYQQLQKEGEEGRRKINQHTRYLTILIAGIQSLGIAIFLERVTGPGSVPIVAHPGIGFRLLTMITLTTGTIFVMWLGEMITEHGIGNGISLLIMIGILSRYPGAAVSMWRMLSKGAMSWFTFGFLLVVVFVITAAVVVVTQAQRRIPVQYAKRVVGRRIYGGQTTHLPLNVNAAGVIPIIFAQSVIMFPASIAQFFSRFEFFQTISDMFSTTSPVYVIVYAGLIVFFAYFYTAIVINPQDLAENMKKYGGFIPGIRPGAKTAEYIDKVMTRITLPGALFFAFIAILPMYLIHKFRVPFYFGGTSLIITVGVILDTAQQIEAQLLMRHYDGFLKSGRIRGRRR